MERLLDHWRGIYGEIFEVIETSGDVARKALAREAMHLPPAKRAKDHSEGARDVAIWFCVLEFLKANPDEHVCFVTSNSSDFGDGIAYPYPMNEDVRGLEDRLTRLKDFDEVVSRFSKEVSGKEAESTADELLRSLSVRSRVAQTAMDLTSSAAFIGLGAADATVEWREWLAQPEVELLSVKEVTGHEIEGDVWYTANATWLLYGLAADGHETTASYVACLWEMKVLFSARDDDETPTVLKTNKPSAPDTSDTASMEILQRLKERVASLSRGAMEHMRGAVSPWERLLARQVAAPLPKLDIASHLNPSIAQIAASMNLEIGTIVGRSGIQEAVAALIKLNPDFNGTRSGIQEAIALTKLNADLNGTRSAMETLRASMPKLDIATALPRTDFPDLVAAAARAQRLADLPSDADCHKNAEGRKEADDQVSLSNADE